MPLEDPRDLVEKLKPAIQEIVAEKGAVSLVALFLREDAPGVWDLVIAAPWARDDARYRDNLNDVISVIKKHLRTDEFLNLSRIILTDPANEYVKSINSRYHVGAGQSLDCASHQIFFGMPMRQATIFKSAGG